MKYFVRNSERESTCYHEFYKGKCDFVLINNGSADEFINNFDILIKDILGGIKNG